MGRKTTTAIINPTFKLDVINKAIPTKSKTMIKKDYLRFHYLLKKACYQMFNDRGEIIREDSIKK
jgi:hypothetical protein